MGKRASIYLLVLTVAGAARAAAADPITVMWDPSTDPQVIGYFVYVGDQSGVYAHKYDVGNATDFVFPDAVAGTLYYFTASSYAAGGIEGPQAAETSGYSNAPPVLTSPGNQTALVGQQVALQLAGSDPYGEPVSYEATGLPPGLILTQSTGLITGAPSGAGIYTVTATVTDGVLSNSEAFTWSVVTIVDTQPPTVTVIGVKAGATIWRRATSIGLIGGATDDTGVTLVSWSNNRGGSGTAAGTSLWWARIPLQEQENVITLSARDAAGNIGSVTFTVHVW